MADEILTSTPMEEYNAKMTALANQSRTLGEADGSKTIEQMTTIISTANTTIDNTQANLITQIKKALDSKVSPVLQQKTVTLTESAQEITADTGYNGLSKVSLNGISSDYVGSSITRRTSSDLTLDGSTVNAPAGYCANSASKSISEGTVTINTPAIDTSTGVITSSATVESGYVSGTPTSKTLALNTQGTTVITPTSSAQTAVEANTYTTGAITVSAVPTGTAGTPIATKGTVSNNSITITPSVTNTTGYITGGTLTGAPTTVTASELVAGHEYITTVAEYDVTNVATAQVYAPALRAENIAEGITILGITGTHSGGGSTKYSGTIRFYGTLNEPTATAEETIFVSFDSQEKAYFRTPVEEGLLGTATFTNASEFSVYIQIADYDTGVTTVAPMCVTGLTGCAEKFNIACSVGLLKDTSASAHLRQVIR